MVGPWQVPVADVAVTTASFDTHAGEAMAMGERPPVALIDPAASARLAVAEAITNLAAAPIAKLSDIKLSANWMSAADHPGENQALYDAVHAVGMELCPALGIAVPVGKDSMSMRTARQEGDDAEEKSITSPLSLVVTGFAPVTDALATLTPQINLEQDESDLILIDPGNGQNRPGGSALARCMAGGRRMPRRGRPGGPESVLRGHSGPEPGWQAAGLPRPQRRWPAGHAAGDGLCGTCRS